MQYTQLKNIFKLYVGIGDRDYDFITQAFGWYPTKGRGAGAPDTMPDAEVVCLKPSLCPLARADPPFQPLGLSQLTAHI